jgi:histidine triad (HIT) family protein
MSDCVFCKILAGAIPAKKLYEDTDVAAFFDVAPQAPVHFLVIPKKHITSLMEAEENDTRLLGKLLQTAQRLAKEQGCGKRGGRFVINCKSDGMQSVNHLHIHVLGGRKLGWPPG